MDRVTQAKIESLLYALRSWEDDAPRPHVQGLADRFKLDPMVVSRIAQAEGIEVGRGVDAPRIDPDRVTAPLSD